MKQSFKVIIFSCLIGGSLAGIFFLGIKNKAEAKTVPIIYAYQVGVFKNYQNAENTKNSYPFAKIVKDKDFYRVFIGITIENKDILKKLFDAEDDYYYIKEITIKEEIYKNIAKYDEMLLKTSDENKKALIKKMLESLPDEL